MSPLSSYPCHAPQVAFAPEPAAQEGPSAPFAFLGYALERGAKDALLARWAKEYPELDEGAAVGAEGLPKRDVGGRVVAMLSACWSCAGRAHQLQHSVGARRRARKKQPAAGWICSVLTY